jgi:hypothetical protein
MTGGFLCKPLGTCLSPAEPFPVGEYGRFDAYSTEIKGIFQAVLQKQDMPEEEWDLCCDAMDFWHTELEEAVNKVYKKGVTAGKICCLAAFGEEKVCNSKLHMTACDSEEGVKWAAMHLALDQ